MGALQDYYDTDDNTNANIYGIRWYAQSFTASQNYNISSVSLRLFRLGSPGTFTVSIRNTLGNGLPTGSDINGVTGTTDGDTLPTGSPYEWREITLSSIIALTSGTQYAIVVRATGGDSGNRVSWRYNGSSDGYAGGRWGRSNDSGSSWISSGTYIDFVFRTYDDYTFSPPVDLVTYRRIVAAVGNKIYYESI